MAFERMGFAWDRTDWTDRRLTLKAVAAAFALVMSLLASQPGAAAQQVATLPQLDFNRFTGSWYEIARLPNKRERSCDGDVVEVIALGDKSKQLQVVTSCKTRKGYIDVRNATARTQKNRGDGELKVTYLWPFSEKDWVLAIGSDMSGPEEAGKDQSGPGLKWLLIGNPNHKALWIFSRSAKLDPSLLSQIEQKAATQGFDTAKLVMTPQSGH